ncbi:MAG: galactokinase [Bacteroidetes bacterium]|nr:galactokinase [Bacteroidota bacterium]MDA1119998.1 galactokinase [Bacteroidota bacterium]
MNTTLVNNLRNIFKETYRVEPQIIVRSPGRINIIGEHTDYNNGFVLPAAIDKGIYIAIALTDSDQSEIISLDMNESVKFQADHPVKSEKHWANYILGVLEQFQIEGHHIPPFKMAFGGDIPIGAGLSSSAALECGVGLALNNLLDLGIDRIKLALIGQAAEHKFVGVNCGIMDQFASLMGKQNQVMLLDCQSLSHQYFPFSSGDYSLVLLNSNVSHSLASSQYNIRRSQCEEGVATIAKKYTDVKSLRDVSLSILIENEKKLSQVVFKRCKYIIEENQRVNTVCKALVNSQLVEVGNILYTAHHAMKTEYEITCPEIDFLVDYSSEDSDVLGSRMMGGGFGGCTINLVRTDAASQWIDSCGIAYKNKFKKELTPIMIAISDGVNLVSQATLR